MRYDLLNFSTMNKSSWSDVCPSFVYTITSQCKILTIKSQTTLVAYKGTELTILQSWSTNLVAYKGVELTKLHHDLLMVEILHWLVTGYTNEGQTSLHELSFGIDLDSNKNKMISNSILMVIIRSIKSPIIGHEQMSSSRHEEGCLRSYIE